MSQLRDQIDKEVDRLREARDELRVQLHLGAADARDAFEALEKRWEHLESKLEQIGRAGKESVEQVGEGVMLVVDELGDGYERIRDLIKKG